METLKFKTNIKCGGCVATVKPHLDGKENIENWQVDLESPDRILTVVAANGSEEEVIATVKEAGYQAEKV